MIGVRAAKSLRKVFACETFGPQVIDFIESGFCENPSFGAFINNLLGVQNLRAPNTGACYGQA